MSGERIDVLAVMDDVEDRLCRLGDSPDGSYVANLREASATVAKLIERERVMREALEDLRQQCKNNLEVGALGPGYWTDAQEAIDAALARATGGA
jgi:hypothetical protein